MPKSYLNEEEKSGLSQNAIFAMESAAAEHAGDEEASWAWLCLAEHPPKSLLFMKHIHGADYVRKSGFNLQPAEKAYGKDWLERDI